MGLLSKLFNKHTASAAAWTCLSAVFTLANMSSAMHGSVIGMGLVGLCGYSTYRNAQAWKFKAGL